MTRALIVFLFVVNSAWAIDYIGRLAADEPAQKGGDSSLASEDTGVSPTDPPPGDTFAPGVITPDSEASEDRSPSPDGPALNPAIFVHSIEMVGVCTGSCVYVGDGLFLVARHVINDSPRNTVIKIDGKQYGGQRSWINEYDVGYLKLTRIPSEWPAARISLTNLLESPIFVSVIGKTTGSHPGVSDPEKKFTNGTVALNLQDSLTVNAGDSGGGVFDTQGNLVGIIVEKVIDSKGTAATTDDTDLPIAVAVPLSTCHQHLPITHLIPESQVAPPPPETVTREVELLLYTASWCSPCKIVQQTTLPEVRAAGITVDERNFDTDPNRIRYGVTSIPCWIALQNGEVVGKLVGSDKSATQVLDLVKGE